MCLAAASPPDNDGSMESREPIYRKICVDCGRPALTFDLSGAAYCGEHSEIFIAIEDTSSGVDEEEIAILLIHRPLVTGVGLVRRSESE